MKSGNSLLHPPEFSDGPETSDPSITRMRKRRRSSSPEPSYVSLKSDRSMKMTHHLSYKTVTTDHLVYRDGQAGALKQDPPGPQPSSARRRVWPPARTVEAPQQPGPSVKPDQWPTTRWKLALPARHQQRYWPSHLRQR
ncbi:hypothetical protein G5714_000040 [Onychostoma macrolepis]|uniref:Uncharacterized protein n=1 Tax=Onychostoma macrolepis TaxID=369639 RepID=A0A7J6DFG8_9TELE|nr:hypothetical protein G5714_000040 [Onychostoma macrolepis]